MCRLRNSYVSVTDGQTDRQTDRQTTDKVIPMGRYASQTDGQTDRQTDDGQSDPYVSLCFAGGTKKDTTKIFQLLAFYSQNDYFVPNLLILDQF